MRMFRDREHAAGQLADSVAYLKDEDPIVVGIPNEGIPIAEAVAARLQAPLDLVLMEKLASPRSPKRIVGAVDEHGRISVIKSSARWHHVGSEQLIGEAREKFRELQSRRARFRSVLPELPVRGRTVIVVSECVTTGAVMLGAISSLRDRGARTIVAAAPAGREDAIWPLHENADAVIIPHKPAKFRSVDKLFETYQPVPDARVEAILQRHIEERDIPAPIVHTRMTNFIAGGSRAIHVELDLPSTPPPFPAVIFAHGFDSNATSPRNVPISRRLAKRGIAGVRLDFTGHGRSDGTPDQCTAEAMLEDLICVVENITCFNEFDPERMGLNGSGTGGMIALRFAANEPRIKRLTIRGPVMGDEIEAARRIEAPTLIIHAEHDRELEQTVTDLNGALAAKHQLLRIPDSNRLFGDPISAELMMNATVQWFADYLLDPVSARPRHSNHHAV